MYYSAVFVFVLTVTVCVTGQLRIIGGKDISINECPYQLSLQKSGKHVCGATVISKSWALTAASCVKGAAVKDLTLRAGSTSHKSGGTVHEVKKVVPHNSYNEKTKDYDIAVIEISKTFDSKTAKPVTLWSEGSESNPGTAALATGWGVRSTGGSVLADTLQQVSLPVVERKVCAAADPRVTERQLCAGYVSGGSDVCEGDWGGPLVSGGRLLGIAAWSSCGRAGGLGVFSSVPALRAWIRTNSGV